MDKTCLQILCDMIPRSFNTQEKLSANKLIFLNDVSHFNLIKI